MAGVEMPVNDQLGEPSPVDPVLCACYKIALENACHCGDVESIIARSLSDYVTRRVVPDVTSDVAAVDCAAFRKTVDELVATIVSLQFQLAKKACDLVGLATLWSERAKRLCASSIHGLLHSEIPVDRALGLGRTLALLGAASSLDSRAKQLRQGSRQTNLPSYLVVDVLQPLLDTCSRRCSADVLVEAIRSMAQLGKAEVPCNPFIQANNWLIEQLVLPPLSPSYEEVLESTIFPRLVQTFQAYVTHLAELMSEVPKTKPLKMWYYVVFCLVQLEESLLSHKNSRPSTGVLCEWVGQQKDMCVQKVIDYHWQLCTGPLLQDVEGRYWMETRPFFEGKRVGFSVCIWRVHVCCLQHDLWECVPLVVASRILSCVLASSIEALASLYSSCHPSEERVQLFKADILVILLTVNHLLPFLQASCSFGTANLTTIHNGCTSLLTLAVALTCPIAFLFSAISEQSSARSGPQDMSDWQEYIPLDNFGLYPHFQEGTYTRDDGLDIFEKCLSLPSPNWPLLIEVICYKQGKLAVEICRQQPTLSLSVIHILCHCFHCPMLLTHVLRELGHCPALSLFARLLKSPMQSVLLSHCESFALSRLQHPDTPQKTIAMCEGRKVLESLRAHLPLVNKPVLLLLRQTMEEECLEGSCSLTVGHKDFDSESFKKLFAKLIHEWVNPDLRVSDELLPVWRLMNEFGEWFSQLLLDQGFCSDDIQLHDQLEMLLADIESLTSETHCLEEDCPTLHRVTASVLAATKEGEHSLKHVHRVFLSNRESLSRWLLKGGTFPALVNATQTDSSVHPCNPVQIYYSLGARPSDTQQLFDANLDYQGFLQQQVSARAGLCSLIGQRWEMQDNATLSLGERTAVDKMKALLRTLAKV